ncbi:MAG: NAD(P)H-hydrate epimerase [Candidatus Omnitrophota bacterium]
MRSITALRARQIDLAAQKIGIPSIVLMENAGREVADTALKSFRDAAKRSVCVFCGKGNNGGDGFVCARYLMNAGAKVSVYVLGSTDAFKKDPLINLSILKKIEARIHFLRDKKDVRKASRKMAHDLIIDAIFGVGFSGMVEGLAFHSIDLINRTDVPVISVDVPSGLNATTGVVGNICVRADTTVTFGLPKQGLTINDGPRFAGEVIVKDIGFPRGLLQ